MWSEISKVNCACYICLRGYFQPATNQLVTEKLGFDGVVATSLSPYFGSFSPFCAMPEQYEVTDSTDWLPTPLSSLAQLESSLRCQVCKDFFTTPMITSCSHTFCSLCIRRYLSQEGKCPACREPDQEIKLRRNWVVEELVTNFTASRKGLLEFAQNAAQSGGDANAESQRPKKRRKMEPPATNGVERRSTRSQSRRADISDSQQSEVSPPEVILDSEDEGSVYEDTGASSPRRPPKPAQEPHEPNDGRVACPCCHRRMKESQINAHLDKCIAGDSSTPIEETILPATAPPRIIGVAIPPNQPTRAPARLPFINYSLLNDNALRKKLRDLGIPNSGTKELMRRRHTEWVNLWNANCDSTNPVSKRQLLQDLRVWEDTLGRQIDRVAAASSGFMAKDFDREGHVKRQKDNFDDLIRQARQKRLVKQVVTGDGAGQEGPEVEALAPEPGGQVAGTESSMVGTGTSTSQRSMPKDAPLPEVFETAPACHPSDSESTAQPDSSVPSQLYHASPPSNIPYSDDALNPQPQRSSAATIMSSQQTSQPRDIAANPEPSIALQPVALPHPPAPSAPSAAVLHHRMWE